MDNAWGDPPPPPPMTKAARRAAAKKAAGTEAPSSSGKAAPKQKTRASHVSHAKVVEAEPEALAATTDSTAEQAAAAQSQFAASTAWRQAPGDPQRYDVPGSSGTNELVRHHPALGAAKGRPRCSSSKSAAAPSSATSGCTAALADHDKAAVAAAVALAKGRTLPLDHHAARFMFNAAKGLAHALHNALQRRCQLNNADEVQLLLVPAGYRGAHGHAATLTRDVYLATNNDRIAQRDVDAVAAGLGALAANGIRKVLVVRGQPGRHAEQKLLDYFFGPLWARAMPTTAASLLAPPVPQEKGAQQKPHHHGGAAVPLVLQPLAVESPGYNVAFARQAFFTLRAQVAAAGEPRDLRGNAVLIGERLACAPCRVYAAAFEDHVHMLPSHGHCYLSTLPATPGAHAMGPDVAAAVLRHGRVLLG